MIPSSVSQTQAACTTCTVGHTAKYLHISRQLNTICSPGDYMHFFGIIKIKQPVQSCFTKIYTQHCQPENFFKAQSNGQFIGYFKPQRAQILIDDQGKEVCTYFLCTCYLFLAKSLSNLNLFRAKCIVAYMIQIAENYCIMC